MNQAELRQLSLERIQDAAALLAGGRWSFAYYVAMDTELLVDDRVDEGRSLLSELSASGFPVRVAVWVRTSEEGRWSLYIASPAVTRGSVGDAYGIAYAALSRLKDPALTLSDLKLVPPDDPIAADAMAVRDRHPAAIPIRYRGERLGGLAIDEAYIYPRTQPGMDRGQVLQTIAQLMNRTGPVQPSLLTLRDGSTMRAIPIGLQAQQPGRGIVAVLHDVASGRDETREIDQIVNIQ